MPRYIYFFGSSQADGGNDLRHLVGGKGASLAEMTRAGLNVPPGFTISAECCELYYKANRVWPAGLEDETQANLTRLEDLVGRRFGRGDNPLLLAVRSGAAHSMPGMMDTVLNVGLNPDCVRLMGRRVNNLRAAWEAYRHFVVMFGHTVAGIPEAVFAGAIAGFLADAKLHHEDELSAGQMEDLASRVSASYRTHAGMDLPADPWEQLVLAIHAVFRSWNSERALTYRQHHAIDGLLGTAVNVQMMCPSEVSGVMFTAHPVNPALEQILIESCYGLGEAVVLGKVTPDRFVVDKKSLRIVEREIALKDDRKLATLADGPAPTASSRRASVLACSVLRDAPSLHDDQVASLARLGMRVENYFRFPCDIEWGLSQGEFYLLQARAIKKLPMADCRLPIENPSQSAICNLKFEISTDERERVRQEEIEALRALADPQGTVWSRFNLAEVLPEPTPMTWVIVRRFMSGQGGFGLMYRDLGFDPDPALDDIGIFDLVCGRPYCNLSREPRIQYRSLPFEHSFAALRADPAKALYPQAVPNLARATWRFWLSLPLLFYKLLKSSQRLARLSQTFARQFRAEIVPPFVALVQKESARDIAALSKDELLEQLNHWVQRTLVDFARQSLKPTVLASLAMENLRRALERAYAVSSNAGQGDETPRQRAEAALRELVMGARPDRQTDLPAAITDLLAGRLERADFLQRFGHRGSQEMELSQPRWSEEPAALEKLFSSRPLTTHHSPLTSHETTGTSGRAPPVADAPGSASYHGDVSSLWQRLAGAAKLRAARIKALEAEALALQEYMGLRESAKHYLMMGYALIRRSLVELDRRYDLQGGIFYLTPDELATLIQKPEGMADVELVEQISRRRRRRLLALSLPVPPVLFSDDLDAIGRAVDNSAPVTDAPGSASLQGVPLSAGVAEGVAWVLEHPQDGAGPQEPYILVCPSTDPAWVPLFVKACGLVMETGGVLSHGAIVAREFGLPAVAGLPAVQRRIRSGQRLRVNGATGEVKILA